MTASPDIFLSYNREDAGVAKTFADAFTREGMEVWWDQALRSGEAYDKVTEAALRGAKAVVVLWSRRSVDSRWVRAEATIAERNGTLVPVRIEPCDLPVMFELTQTADLTGWEGPADDSNWQTFLRDVRRMVGKDAPESVSEPGPNSAPAGSGVPLVAVLPITHRGNDEELEVLAEDLTEDITRELAQDSYFKVIAASTMAEWRGAKINHKQLGRELGASYFIEGKLQFLAENARLTVQLIDVATGEMLRSARHLRKLADFAVAPEEFPVTIASEFGEYITEIEAKRAMEKRGPYSGWDHAMRALALMERPTNDTAFQAIAEAEQAIAKAPDLGLAHAELARMINVIAVMEGQTLSDQRRRSIQEHIGKAMQLDGNNPAILHLVVGAYTNLGDGESAQRIAERAMALNPNSPRSHFSMGLALLSRGRYVEAIGSFRKQLTITAHDLDRPAALILLGVCLIMEDKPAEAEAVLDRSRALHPNSTLTLAFKAIAKALQGQEDAARATIAELRDVAETQTFDHRFFAIRALTRGRADEYETIFRRLWDATEGGG